MIRAGLATAIGLLLAGSAAAQAPRTDVEYYRLVPGFVAEAKDDFGIATGYSAPNRWGQYTAYLMATNAKGQRSWRIEHYAPMAGSGIVQGSTMYLLEGSKQALLIDTASPAEATEGVNDLKTLVRHLLRHENDGRKRRAKPLDFVVANTHDHGDHIGENKRMSDRTVYYMDGDWPKDAPSNYVPIREGGGATANGKGSAVGEIDLGDRLIKAVAIPPHTPGSTGYLDAENRMLVTGDAMGSGQPWLQWSSVATYVRSADHVEELTRAMPDLVVLPAHFYQIASHGRGAPPISGRPLDRQYVIDQQKSAHGILDGSVEGEPYYLVGGPALKGGVGTAAIVYSLGNIDPREGPAATPYRAARFPGSPESGYVRSAALNKLTKAAEQVKADVHQIRSSDGSIMQLVVGSRAALLIGTGQGEPGLAEFVAKLAGGKPLEVALTSDDPALAAGLAQLRPAVVHAAGEVGNGVKASRLAESSVIDLGTDRAGRPLQLRAVALPGHRANSVTLIDTTNRILFAGDALGAQGPDAGLTLATSPAAYKAALAQWRRKTDGAYDFVFTSANEQWSLPPAYVERLAEAVDRAASGEPRYAAPSQLRPGMLSVKSDGPPDQVASVALAGR